MFVPFFGFKIEQLFFFLGGGLKLSKNLEVCQIFVSFSEPVVQTFRHFWGALMKS